MRKVVVGAFVTLDGVMQAPGGPHEDPTGGFKFGGWLPPLWDEASEKAISEMFSEPFDLLLGRKTYEIFAAFWPYQDDEIGRSFNAVTKYVATRAGTELSWEKSVALQDGVANVRRLKAEDGPILLTQGSTELVHALLAADLVDELNVLTFPIVVGKGKRLFDSGAAPAGYELQDHKVSDTGVIIARYRRGGEVRTGSFGADNPSAAEVARRERWGREG